MENVEVGQLWRPKWNCTVPLRNDKIADRAPSSLRGWVEPGAFYVNHNDVVRVLSYGKTIDRNKGRYLAIFCLHLNTCEVVYYLPYGNEPCFDGQWELIS